MKSFLFYIPVVLFLFSSCRKESLIPIDEIDTEDPTEIEGAFFKGTVADETGNQPNILVDIYQHERKAGTVTTDQNGAFNTFGIPLDTIGHVTFAVKQSDNRIKAKRVRPESRKTEIGTIFLDKENVIQTTQDYLENPGSNDLVVVSGYIKDPSGNPAQADVALLYDVSEPSPGEYYAEGEVTVSDENGYYEMLVPRDQEFYYFVQQTGCTPKLLSKDEVRIFDGFFPVEVIGPFSSDTELPALNNAIPNADNAVEQNISFYLIATTCNGTSVENGAVEGTISKGTQTFPLNAATIASLLIWTKNYCIKEQNQNAPWIVKFKIKDFKNNKISEEKTFEITEKDQELGTIVVCEDISTEKPFIQWSVGLINHEYEILPGLIAANGELESSGVHTSANGLLKFTVPNYTSGGTLMKGFRFLGTTVGKPYDFFQKDTEVVNITFINTGDPKKIKGTFEGNIYTSTVDASLPVKGSFLIKLP